ncbi:hypothetical protein GCM10027413_22180 [Conyzicola nivalis]|uniref:NERD domain-containing protein n=1 Tax=Conyzicola nivalis TaxID=1477021 RepID=A0A916SC20_9MICO|nr:nuclease-related domain-containing protein [Conyzicola nivalis]GGA92994.1 hypothetical protein GCM10010979_04440 [Conyzicola nivalis]
MTDIRQNGAPSAPPSPPEFAEPSLSKVRPSAQQLAVQAIASEALVAPASVTAVASAPLSVPALPPSSALAHDLALAAAGSLRSRVPAFALMKECLRVQSSAPERSALARVLGREPLHPDALSWYRGAVGELQVARVLGKLDPRWTVLQAVPVGSAGADIDHVLIGLGGTFTINTKNHGGKKVWAAGTTFMVNGQKLAHIHHSTFEAQRAARLLTDATGTSVSVTPLIVLVNPASLARKMPDVTVLDATELLRWIRRQPQMQTDATVARITWAAARRDTWTTLVDDGAVPAKSPGHVEDDYEQQFAARRAEVDAAQSRRRAWSLLVALAFLSGVVGATLLLAPFIPEILSKLVGGL